MGKHKFNILSRSGFTLIELLIVVAIIAILAAIAVPNFLEAQTRSKVSRVKADQRTAATAIECYQVDNNRYPPHYFPGTTTINTQSQYTLWRLTTPVAYITSNDTFRDPFVVNQIKVGAGLPGAGTVYAQRYMLYQNFESFLKDYNLSGAYKDFKAWSICSVGPDQADDAAQWRMYNYACDPTNPNWQKEFLAGVYDPTNGTVSQGDIARFGGSVPPAAAQVSR